MPGNSFVTCCYCKCGFRKEDVRPYGRNRLFTCFPCSQKPENLETTQSHFTNRLNQIVQDHKVPMLTQSGIIALTPEQAVAAQYNRPPGPLQ